MPNVPEYEPGQAQQVGIPDVGRPYVPPAAAFGAGIGAALVDVADSGAEVYVDHEIAAAKEVEANFRRGLLDLGMGQDGYYLKKGKDAVENYERFGTDIQKLYTQSIDQLGTGTRANVGGPVLQQLMQREFEASRIHQVKESDTYRKEVSLGRQAVLTQQAALYFGDPQRLAESLGGIQNEVIERSKLDGLDGPAVQAEIAKAQSQCDLRCNRDRCGCLQRDEKRSEGVKD